METMENVAFEIILHAGNARSEAMEAIYESRRGKTEEAKEHLKLAKEEIGVAHQAQSQLLFKDAEEQISMGVLLTHALDHISMASVVYDMAEEMVLLRREMLELKHELKEAKGEVK